MKKDKQFNPDLYEKKWLDKWQKSRIGFVSDKAGSSKYYILDMFPYPSGAGLHVGHVEGYTATDILSRFYRMNGKNVLHPMGWDSFGLPAENYAIKTGVHPKITTERAIETFTNQMNKMGFAYDWGREIATHKPQYYKWTQWLFQFLFDKGLAYRAKAPVNWCSSCKTVLANEQVVEGMCERCDSEVIQKDMEQWFFRITKYAERLLKDLEKIDWPESTKQGQRNWIGKSIGASILFPVKGTSDKIEVFTTRPDTLYGTTYVVLSPEHPMVDKLTTSEHKKEINEYKHKARKKTALQRSAIEKQKTGICTGSFCIHPLTGKLLPIWVADYVLMSYGTGAVMAVPAHDKRDWEFAKKYRLPIIQVIKPKVNKKYDGCFTNEGIVINSGKYNGMPSKEARIHIVEHLERKGLGRKKTVYKLRDWLISRQRYWGAPIPMIWCNSCGWQKVPEKDLPVLLPDNIDFKPTGESPLAESQAFSKVVCPSCGLNHARREFDTMDTFVDSSWYYMRFVDPHNQNCFAQKDKMTRWLPVDVYVGGAEHTVLHLLYSRFITKVLYDSGLISFDEPFQKLRHQGIILSYDHKRMSKSRGNIINPDHEIKHFGADTLRLYEMFMGPFQDMKPWDTKGIRGVRRFLLKIWKAQFLVDYTGQFHSIEQNRILNKTIDYATTSIPIFAFNTTISKYMELINVLGRKEKIEKKVWDKFLLIIAPFAPFVAEELWERAGNKYSIHEKDWPSIDRELIKKQDMHIAIQVNGKVRAVIEVKPSAGKDEVVAFSKKHPNVQRHIKEKSIKRTIYIKGSVVNFYQNNTLSDIIAK